MKASATRGNERFQIVEFANPSGAVAFRVTGRTVDGKRIRENFKTHAEAVARRSVLEIESENLANAARPQVTRLQPEQLAIAERAFDRLAGKSMLDAIEYYLKNFKRPDLEITVAAAFAEFVADGTKANLRPQTLRSYGQACSSLLANYGTRQLASIATDAIERLVFTDDRSPATCRFYRTHLHGFFAWALTKRYCAVNPVADVRRPKVDRHEPAILSPEEAERLLRAAQKHKGGVLVPYVAAATFAGLRPTELARLSWDKIDLAAKTVTIGSDVAKMRGRRVVEIAENLVEWLKPFAKKKPALVGVNWRKDFDAVKEAAGFGTPTDDKPKLKPWTQDIMRHSAISYHLAQHQHEGKTASWAGNSPDIVQRHYKGLVTPAEVVKFWGIGPKAKKPAKAKAKGKVLKVNFKGKAAA